MSERAVTEVEASQDSIVRSGAEPAITPFAELSRLMLVGIDSNQNNNLLWTAQTAPNGPWDRIYAPVNTEYSYILLGTGSTVDGRVAVAAQTRAAPQVVHYIDEAEEGPDGEERWNAPVDLGMPDGVGGFVDLVMGRDADGRVEIFGVDGNSGTVWWIYQNPDQIVDTTEEVTPPGSTTPITVHVQVAEPPAQPWSGWTSLPGTGIARLRVANDASGRILLVGTGKDPSATSVNVISQMVATALNPSDWSGWSRIDNADSGTAQSVPTAVLDNDGAVNIFMVGSLTQVVQIRQKPPGGPGGPGWSAWSRPGMVGQTLVNVTSAFAGNGEIVLVALDENLGVHANYQVDVDKLQQWSGWQQIGVAPGFGLPAMDYNADGSLTYFQGQNSIDGVQFISQTAPDSTSWSAGWTMLADNGIFTYGIVRDLTPPSSS